MNLRTSFTEKVSKTLLTLLFGFSLINTGYAYSQSKEQLSEQYENNVYSKTINLQLLVETYNTTNKNYPVKVLDLKTKGSDSQTVRSSTGKIFKFPDIIADSIDYSSYQKSGNKNAFKNKIVYKPLNISQDGLFALDYQIYFTDAKGDLLKIENSVYCVGTIDCDSNKAAVIKEADNFSNPDGFTDSTYKYFAIRRNKSGPTHNQIIDRSLMELKKGNKTQQIYSNLILAYSMTKQRDKADKVALDFIKDFPNSSEAYHSLSFVYKDKSKKAIELLKKAVSLNPNNPSYRMDLAATYVHNGQTDKALTEYQKIKTLMKMEI